MLFNAFGVLIVVYFASAAPFYYVLSWHLKYPAAKWAWNAGNVIYAPVHWLVDHNLAFNKFYSWQSYWLSERFGWP
jgi:hypothetical protein